MVSLHRWLVLSAIYGPGIALDALKILTHLILTRPLWGRFYYYYHFTGEGSKAQENVSLSPKVTVIVGGRTRIWIQVVLHKLCCHACEYMKIKELTGPDKLDNIRYRSRIEVMVTPKCFPWLWEGGHCPDKKTKKRSQFNLVFRHILWSNGKMWRWKRPARQETRTRDVDVIFFKLSRFIRLWYQKH